MRGSLGLVIGLVVGAGGMYLALRPPWAHPATVSTPGPPVVMVAQDAGVDAKTRKHRGGGGGHHGGGAGTPTTSDPGGNGGSGGDDSSEDTEPAPLTDADRRLEWRGDDVVLPPHEVNMTTGAAESRALDEGEINDGVNRGAGGLRDCVVQGATGTDLRATITYKMLVDGKGHVTRSRVQAPHYLFDKGLLGCSQRALTKLSFAATGAPTIVTLPVNLG